MQDLIKSTYYSNNLRILLDFLGIQSQNLQVMSFLSSFLKVVPHFFYLPYGIGYCWVYINSLARDFHTCGDYKFGLHTLYDAGLGF